MPTKPTSGTTSAKPSMKSKPKLTVKELQELHNVQAAEEQAATEDAERAENRAAIGAIPLEMGGDESQAPVENAVTSQRGEPVESAAPSRRKATKWLREKCWLHLAKQAKFPLAKQDGDDGLVLFSAEEEGEHYVYVTHRAHGEHREDEVSRMVDQYQAVLEQHGLETERVMRDMRTSVRLHVTRTDDDAKQTAVRKPATHTSRSLKRQADDDQDQTGDGMGI